MTSPAPRVALFTRFPEPGRAKTRLIPALGAEGAAALHRRLAERALAAVRGSALPFELRGTGASAASFRDWLGPDVALADQGGGTLGERMARVPPPAILVGTDIPDLHPAHLIAAAAALRTHPAAIGPAEDGGYYLLGLARPMPFLFTAMPWGAADVFALTLRRMAEHGIAPAVLDTLADLDRPEDLARWPGLLP